MPQPAPNSDFATTHWSLIVSSRQQDSDVRRNSLSELYVQYSYPLFAFLRRKGHGVHEAADFVQGFFVELIDKDFLKAVAPEKGRFRWFLMSAIRRFVMNQSAKQKTQKRGGDRAFFSLDVDDAEQRYQLEPVDGWTAEKLFDRRWALEVLARALDQLESEHEAQGKLELFQDLRDTLTGIPLTSDRCSEIAEKFSKSPGAIKVAAHRMRDKYRQLLVAIVAQTVVDSSGVDSELDDLLAALGG